MALQFQITHRFAAPPDAVWRGLTELENGPAWMPSLVRIEPLTEGPMRPGSQWRETRRIFKREATEQFEVTTMEPPRHLGLRVDGTKGASKRGEYLFEYHLEPDGAGTLLTLDSEIRGMGLMGAIFGWLLAGSFRKAIVRDLVAMERYLDGTPAEPS